MRFRDWIRNWTSLGAVVVILIFTLRCQVDDSSEKKVLLSIQSDSTYLKFGKVWVGLVPEGKDDTTVVWKEDSLPAFDRLIKIPMNIPEKGLIHIIIRGYQSGTGKLIYEEIRVIDVATGELISSTIPIDLSSQGFRRPRARISIANKNLSIKDTARFEAIVVDTDGIVFSYAWDFLGNGSFGSEYAFEKEVTPVKAEKIYADTGHFKAIIRIKDAARKAYFDTLDFVVSQDPPTADAGQDTSVSAGDSVHLHGLGRDSLGFLVSREWGSGSGQYAFSKTGDTSFLAPVVAGNYSWFFRVTDDDGNQTEDSMTLVVLYHNDAYLASLEIDSIPLIPDFERSKDTYSASAAYPMDSIWVHYRTEDSTALAKLDGSPAGGHDERIKVPLKAGGNLIKISVYAQNGTGKKDYVVYVQRRLNTDATLSGLSVYPGKLSPEFSNKIYEYSVTLENGESNLTVAPELSDRANGKLFVNGLARLSGDIGQALSMRTGLDTVDIKVIAQEDTLQTDYRIIVSRLPSHDATLKNLILNVGNMTPDFSPSVLRYSDTLPNTIGTIGFKATTGTSTSKIYLNGELMVSDETKSNMPLKVGDNVFNVKVIAENGDTGAYQVRIRRLSANSNIGNLTIDHGRLSPSFASDRFEYADTVQGSVDTVRIGINAADSSVRSLRIRQETINGYVSARTIPISDGNNIVSLGVVAEDGSSSTYTVTIYRRNSDSTLDGITPNVGVIAPSFSKFVKSYSIILPNSQTGISFNAPPSNPLARVFLEGTLLVPSAGTGIIRLQPGTQLFHFRVLSESGDSMTYSVSVHRKSVDANLASFDIDQGILSPAFSPSVLNYRDTLAAGAKSVKISVKAEDTLVQAISIQGNAFQTTSASLSVPWAPLGAPIQILVTVTPEEGAPKSYSIKVAGSGFIKRYATKDDDNSVGVIPADGGGFYALDLVSQNNSQVIKSLLVKFDSDGDTLWSEIINANAIGDGMIISDHRTILAYGTSGAPGTNVQDGYIAELDLSGKVLWEKMYGSALSQEELLSATETNDGGYALAGYSSPASGNGSDLFVTRINSSGDTLWTHTYVTPTDEETGYSILQLPDKGFLVAGQNRTSLPVTARTCVARLDSLGNLQWIKSYGAGSVSQAKAIDLMADGNYVVFGAIMPANTSKYNGMALVVKPNGDSADIKSVVAEFNTIFSSMTRTRDRGFLAFGASNSSALSGSQDALIVKMDANLNVVMKKTYGGDKDDYLQIAAQSSDGGYFLLGSTYSYGSTSRDCLIIRTNPEGETE